jgi:hypothetical protein
MPSVSFQRAALTGTAVLFVWIAAWVFNVPNLMHRLSGSLEKMQSDADGNTLYLDTQSIRKENGYVSLWARILPDRPRPGVIDEIRIQMRIDCKDKTYREINLYYMDGRKLDLVGGVPTYTGTTTKQGYEKRLSDRVC